LQERHRSGAARFQLSGSAFGSHKPNHAIAQIKYPLFMRDSIKASATNLVPAGSAIIVTRVGLGKVGLAEQDLCFSQDSHALIFDPKRFDSKFVVLQMGQLVSVFKHISRGTTISGVTKKQLLSVEFLAPSLPEQRRIVAEIEKQFTRLEAGVAALRRVQANLKRYRAAVLKAACEGELVPTEAELRRTADYADSTDKKFRKSVSSAQSAVKTSAFSLQPSAFESGAALLARILTERRQNWQGRGQYKEPAAPDTPNLPPLPEGWARASIEQVTHTVYRYPTFFGMEHLSNGVPVIRGEHLLPGNRISTDWSDYWFVAPDVSAKFPKTVVGFGDIVMSVRGSVGKLGIVNEEITGAQVSPNCIRIALVHPLVLPKWFVAVFGSSAGVARVKEDVNQTTIETIKSTVFIRTPFPLPPLAEQTRIVAEVERRLSVVEELEAVVSANLQRATRLRQSILQKAFTGGLV